MTQTIRRAARRHRYVIVDQAAVEDTRLSWAARGLLAYLLSRPDDWKVLVNDLKKRGNLGRDGIYALLRELRQTGYVRFERNRDAQGRMYGGTYIVSEIPHPASPDVGAPAAAAPRPVNAGALPNTDRKQRTTTTTRPTDTYGAATAMKAALRFPDWLPTEMHAPATRLVAVLDSADAQLVIDEWTGALAAGAVKRSPLGYLKTLAVRCQAGDMSPRYAGVVSLL
ncbi:MAG: helix-turn-helix domain-containing protein [Gammaproteobacteria bacterium]|nr:helix-turn-helix domain-containing protein [Gammaproteobacteria bacterium]